jgi:hypothetical protein
VKNRRDRVIAVIWWSELKSAVLKAALFFFSANGQSIKNLSLFSADPVFK